MLTAPVSSLIEFIRPLSKEVKNVSGIHVSVDLEVENRCPPTFKVTIDLGSSVVSISTIYLK